MKFQKILSGVSLCILFICGILLTALVDKSNSEPILSLPTTSVSAAVFSDVNESGWYFDNVTAMTENGYLTGYPDGSFKPDDKITTAEFVSVIARICGLEKSASLNNHWAGELLQTALNKKWYDWDEIPPTSETYDNPIIRQVAVKIVMNAFAPTIRGEYNIETAKMADFSSLDGRYYDAVIAAYSKGIANGDDSGNFNPKSSLTRAEACALISRE